MTAVVTVSRRIAASAERLFDAWLDPKSLAVWMRRDGSAPSGAVADRRVFGVQSREALSNSSWPKHRRDNLATGHR